MLITALDYSHLLTLMLHCFIIYSDIELGISPNLITEENYYGFNCPAHRRA